MPPASGGWWSGSFAEPGERDQRLLGVEDQAAGLGGGGEGAQAKAVSSSVSSFAVMTGSLSQRSTPRPIAPSMASTANWV